MSKHDHFKKILFLLDVLLNYVLNMNSYDFVTFFRLIY